MENQITIATTEYEKLLSRLITDNFNNKDDYIFEIETLEFAFNELTNSSARLDKKTSQSVANFQNLCLKLIMQRVDRLDQVSCFAWSIANGDRADIKEYIESLGETGKNEFPELWGMVA